MLFMPRQPSLFIPHGGGPCFFMDDPHGTWTGMQRFLASLPSHLPQTPAAIVLVSGHWETAGFCLTGGEHPALVYDYRGFPAHTYQLRYDAPGDPDLARRAAALLQDAGLDAALDDHRGFDHGMFVPLKVAFPDANVPVVQLALDRSLDPALHLAAGRALAPLREQGVLIVGSGMSFHNMRGYGDPAFTAVSDDFDAWLASSLALAGHARAERLEQWQQAPGARTAHPRAEHLLPLMVAAGAAAGPGERVYAEHVLDVAISGYRFD
jgi:aromatic ring-opening dioxygenase catalytic subunit (LigB family)